jgi:hypothetical protein
MSFDSVAQMFGGGRPFAARSRTRAPKVPTMRVETERDLARIRHWLASIWFDDELRDGDGVTLTRYGVPVGTIACADAVLAWESSASVQEQGSDSKTTTPKTGDKPPNDLHNERQPHRLASSRHGGTGAPPYRPHFRRRFTVRITS